jgi:hypothetical protein
VPLAVGLAASSCWGRTGPRRFRSLRAAVIAPQGEQGHLCHQLKIAAQNQPAPVVVAPAVGDAKLTVLE